MNKYLVFIDIMNGSSDDVDDDDYIEGVESLTVEANNCIEALEKAQDVASKKYDCYYVWEVMEEDRV